MPDELPNLEGDGGYGREASPVVIVGGNFVSSSLLDAADADANGDSIVWIGGKGVMFASGTWGGGDVELQWSDDDSSFWTLGTGYTLSANGLVQFELPAGYLRAVLSGSSSPLLDAVVKHI